MNKVNAGFAYCVKKFGQPSKGESVPSAVCEMYRHIVPPSMLDFWNEYGVGIWLDGRFQLVRPDRYKGLIEMVLAGDPDFPAEDSALIGFTAFGQLMIWNNRNYFLQLDLVKKYAYTRHVDHSHPILDADRALPGVLSDLDLEAFDFIEGNDAAKPLFARAVKKCGKLTYGECYGFVPAVGLGGRGVLDEVQRVRALEHFSIIAQLAPIQLRYMDTENRKIVVLRELGG